jgi:simple sugar transport system permease protein
LEGVLILSAMAGFGAAWLSDSVWVGVICAGLAGALLAALHGLVCSLPRVNDIAVGIGIMMLGTGLAFFLGKPLMEPQAPQIPSIALGDWSSAPSVQAALRVNALFPIGIALAALMHWAFANTRWGLLVRMVGDSADAARALGNSVNGIRIAATTAGGFIAGLGGAALSLYYPGSWNEGLSSGQGLIAVALVIFARWSPLRCLGAAVLFGGAGAIGPALQSVGVGGAYYLFNALPYALTLLILVVSCSPTRTARGAPLELGVTR